jgi:hypothetical protein
LAADKLGSVETLDHVVDLSLRISRNVGLKLLAARRTWRVPSSLWMILRASARERLFSPPEARLNLAAMNRSNLIE